MNIKRILILSAVCVCAAACNYLDVVPLGSPKMDDLFRTHTQANKFACAMYSHVYQPNKYDINASMEPEETDGTSTGRASYSTT